MSAFPRQPATAAQEGLWIAHQLDDTGTAYLTAELLHLSGELDVARFTRAVQNVLDAAPTLHQRFDRADERLWQTPQPARTRLERVDCSVPCGPAGEPDPAQAESRAMSQDRAHAWISAALGQRCDVSRDALYRTALLQMGPQRYAWYLQIHHLVIDGFGYTLLLQAVAAQYRALQEDSSASLERPDWSLQRILQAESDYCASGQRGRDRAFWRAHLSQRPAPATLEPMAIPAAAPTAQTRWDSTQRSGVHRHSTRLETGQDPALRTTAAPSGGDVSAWMLAAVGVWLARQCRQRHLCIGLPVLNRLGTPALAVPCMVMNIVPFQIHLPAGLRWGELVRRCQQQMRTLRPHLQYRYGWMRQDLNPQADGPPLFSQVINLMPFERSIDFGPTLRCRSQLLSAGPVNDINLTLTRDSGQWQLTLEASSHRYSAAQSLGLAQDLGAWLARAGTLPDDQNLDALDGPFALPRSSRMEGMALPACSARHAVPQPGFLALWNAVVRQQPGAPALEDGPRTWNHRALRSATVRLAQRLTRAGVTPGQPVVVALPRGAAAIIAALAVMWRGAVYVPLDPAAPRQRVQDLLAQARPVLMLVATGGGKVPEALDAPEALNTLANAAQVPVLALPSDISPDDMKGRAEDSPADTSDDSPPDLPPEAAAALLYTSGSTGQPKGVLIGHGALGQFVTSTAPIYAIQPQDRVLQFAPLHFDASLEEILITLCQGATLVMRPPDLMESPQHFTAGLERLAISVADLPTAFWHVWVHALQADAAPRLAALRLTVIGGEAAQPERVAQWRQRLPAHPLINTYGPTEAGIIATSAWLNGPQAAPRPSARSGSNPAHGVPIGVPRPGLTVHLVDAALYPVAEGCEGELLISGPALALGYFRQDALTAQCFVTLPDAAASAPLRAYRTGDRAVMHDGVLYFLGRLDARIKISGHWIDPLEIENTLLALSRQEDSAGLIEAAVLPSPDQAGLGCAGLDAFVVYASGDRADADADADADAGTLRARLAQVLPPVALPQRWHTVAALPRNANGKIDRRALHQTLLRQRAAQQPSGAAEATATAQKQSTTAAAIAAVWQEVLQQPVAASEAAHFFDLGGQSLQALQACGLLSQRLARAVPVSLLFRHPRLPDLAAALDQPEAYPMPQGEPGADALASLLPIAPGAGGQVLWCLYPADGLAWAYLRLAPHLPGVRIMGLQLDPLTDATAEADPTVTTGSAQRFQALVQHLVQRIRRQQPRGPYHLLGWSLGGALAHGIAAELQHAGERLGVLALMDAYPADAWRQFPLPTQADIWRLLLLSTAPAALPQARDDTDIARTVREHLLTPSSPWTALGESGLNAWAAMLWRQVLDYRASATPQTEGRILLFHARDNPAGKPGPKDWLPHLETPGLLEVIALPCSHNALSDPQPMRQIGQALATRLAACADPAPLNRRPP